MKTVLKIAIAIVLLMNVIKATGQAAIGVQITQDGKLAVYDNDGHGNKAFTTDIQIKSVWQGFDTDLGYLSIAPKYEYADLADGAYQRFGFEIAYSFHTYIIGIDLTPSIGSGFATRWDSRWWNMEYSFEVKIPITKDLSGIVLTNVNNRKDIGKIGYNIGYGLRYDIITDYNRVTDGHTTRFRKR